MRGQGKSIWLYAYRAVCVWGFVFGSLALTQPAYACDSSADCSSEEACGADLECHTKTACDEDEDCSDSYLIYCNQEYYVCGNDYGDLCSQDSDCLNNHCEAGTCGFSKGSGVCTADNEQVVCSSGSCADVGNVCEGLTIINPNGGVTVEAGLRIFVGPFLDMQIHRYSETYGVAVGQLYGFLDVPALDGASMGNSIYVAVGSDVYGSSSALGSAIDWTFVSQSDITGDGTAESPWTMTTVVEAGSTGVTLSLETKYVSPRDWFNLIATVTIPDLNSEEVKFYHLIDTQLGGSDAGPAYVSPDPDTATPTFVAVQNFGIVEAFSQPDPIWDFYYSANYDEQFENIVGGGNITGSDEPGTLDYSEETDNGIGVQWNLGSAAGAQVINYALFFSTEVPCTTDSECSPGYCNFETGECTDAKLADGTEIPVDHGTCAADPELAAGACLSGSCDEEANTCGSGGSSVASDDDESESGLPATSACTLDSQCSSGSCKEGHCTRPGAHTLGNGIFSSCSSTSANGSDNSGLFGTAFFVLAMMLIRRVMIGRRAWKMSGVGAALVLMLGMLIPTQGYSAVGDGFGLDRYTPADAGSRWLNADSLAPNRGLFDKRVQSGLPSLALRFDLAYARSPLILVNEATDTLGRVVANQLTGTIGASMFVLPKLRVSIALPVQLYANGTSLSDDSHYVPSPQHAGSLGDLRVGGMYRFDTVYGDALRFGVGARLRIPTGDKASYAGDGTTSGTLYAAAAGDVSHLTWAASVGTRIRSKDTFVGNQLGTELQATAAAGYQTDDRKFMVGLEVPFVSVLTATDPFAGKNVSIDPAVGAHWWKSPQWGVHAGVGTSLTSAVGAAQWRGMITLEYWPATAEAAPVVVVDADSDKDGIADKFDNCPTVAGTADNRGCAVKQSVVMDGNKLNITEKVRFGVGSAEILAESFAVLDNLAEVLVSHPGIKRLRVEGHTDNEGAAENNLNLSKQRASAVMNYLVAHGVEQSRLESAGFGDQHPLVANDTAEGRATNRRVEFVIVNSK